MKGWRNFVQDVGQNSHMKGQSIATTVANRRLQVKTIFIPKIKFQVSPEITELINFIYDVMHWLDFWFVINLSL